MGGFPSGEPNQWWRFILPLFLHVGCIHLAINIFVQVGRARRGRPGHRGRGAAARATRLSEHARRCRRTATRSRCTQLWRGVAIEREIGAIRMGLIYMLSGVFGIVLGANMSPYQGTRDCGVAPPPRADRPAHAAARTTRA